MLQGLDNTGLYDVYFDGSKSVVRTELLRSAIPDIKVVHMVRHPGAYLYHFHSTWQHKVRDASAPLVSLSSSCSFTYAALWQPENVLAVTYESIVKYPDQFVQTMEGFVGMESIRLMRIVLEFTETRFTSSATACGRPQTGLLDYSSTWRGKMPVRSGRNGRPGYPQRQLAARIVFRILR